MASETKTSVLESSSTFVIEPWNVILLNDDRHTFDEVIVQIVKAVKCTAQKASGIAWEAHAKGEAVCFTGHRERCEYVASVLEEIGLGVRMEKAE